MSNRPTLMTRYRIAAWLVGIHSFLVLLLGFMSGSPALHDQSPMMLLPLFLYAVDYPIHGLLGHFVPMTMDAFYLTLVLVFGGLYWLVNGIIVRALIITFRHDAAQHRHSVGNGRLSSGGNGSPVN